MLTTRIYDRYEAVEYALRYAIIPNPAYYDFSAIGGDCTNFVSQCLYAGCKVMNYSQNGWYYNNINSRSPSWTSVEALYRFLTTNKSVGPRGYAVNLKEAQIGDIIQLGKFHCLLLNFITRQLKDHNPLARIVAVEEVAAFDFVVEFKLVDGHKIAHELVRWVIEEQ